MSEKVTAVTGGVLWDGTGADPVDDATVLVQGQRILDAGPSKEVNVPAGAEVIDARGETVIPGLMDLHVHIFQKRHF